MQLAAVAQLSEQTDNRRRRVCEILDARRDDDDIEVVT